MISGAESLWSDIFLENLLPRSGSVLSFLSLFGMVVGSLFV